MAVEVTRLLPVGRLRRQWDSRREVTRAQGLVPAILEAIPLPSGTRPPADWRILSAHWTDLDVVVMLVGPLDGPASVAVKLPRTQEGVLSLRRQAQVLGALHSEHWLNGWSGLMPRPLAAGEIGGQDYFVESALPGGSAHRMRANSGARNGLQTAAAEAIRQFHARTASSVVVDGELLERWIEVPLLRLRQLMAGRWRAEAQEAAIERLAHELRDALDGRRLSASWVHGDFWTGNLLVAGGESVALTGIVDWDLAAPQDLPLRDLLHLLLYTRKLVQRCELGDVVRQLLVEANWTRHERELIDAMDEALPGDYLSERTRVLIYWLRHVSANLGQSQAYTRNWLWVSRNIGNVLRVL